MTSRNSLVEKITCMEIYEYFRMLEKKFKKRKIRKIEYILI